MELAKARKTVYEFEKTPVTRRQAAAILEAACWTPSCSNSQPWRFVIVTDAKKIAALLQGVRLVNFPFVSSNPPLIIAFVADGGCLSAKHLCLSDGIIHDAFLCVSMSVMQAALQAKQIGLDSCILTPSRANVSKVLSIPKQDVPVLLLGVGKEKKGAFARNRTRRKRSELTYFEKFGRKG